MARNGSGTWSAPVGQPVVAGTTIDPTAHNGLVADIGTEITDSLSRSGKGAMLTDLPMGGKSLTNWYQNIVQALASAALSLKGAIADGASAVGVILDNTVALANAGAKLVSFRNAGVEKAYITKDGALYSVPEDAIALISGGANWTITTDPGSAGHSHLKRTAGIVLGNVTATAAAGASFGSILTLPVGYRPSAQIDFMGLLYDSSATTFYGCRVSITSSGAVSMTLYDNGTALVTPFAIGDSDQVAFTFCYPVAD